MLESQVVQLIDPSPIKPYFTYTSSFSILRRILFVIHHYQTRNSAVDRDTLQ